MRRVRIPGFTIVELLVVLAILGLLLALLLPAIQAARQSASSAECQNHLRQIGVAMNSYHADHAMFPPGYVSETPFGGGWGWSAMLLPYLEQKAIHDLLNFEAGYSTSANSTACAMTVQVYYCPASREAPPSGLGAMNYLGSAGPSGDDGVLFKDSSTRKDAILDGLSATLLVSESAATVPWAGGATVVFSNKEQTSSEHPGVTNSLFADGVVHPIGTNMDDAVFRAIATIEGKELTPGF